MLFVWNGSSWVFTKKLKVWDGFAWVESKYGKVWNGSSWVPFYSAYQAQLFDATYTRIQLSPASFQVNSNGNIYASVGNTQLDGPDYQWLTGIGTGSNYQVKADYVSGVTPGGSALGTWLSLSTSAQWNVTAGIGVYNYSVINVSIRDAGTGVVLAGPVPITVECNRL